MVTEMELNDPIISDTKTNLMMNYTAFGPLAIQGVKELNTKLDSSNLELTNRLKIVESELLALKTFIKSKFSEYKV